MASTKTIKSLRNAGFSNGEFATGPRNHFLDVPGGLGVAHRSFFDAQAEVCTGFSVIQPSAKPMDRRAAGVFCLNGSGELTNAHAIREWGFLETPIVLTNTPSVGLAYHGVNRWMMQRVPEIGRERQVVIPVVGECDDSLMHEPRGFVWGENDLFNALDEALEIAQSGGVSDSVFTQAGQLGCVGAGMGTACFEFKGGIGSSSRVFKVRGTAWHVGVLLQTNFGLRQQLQVLGKSVGKQLSAALPKSFKEGSCIGVLATDAPLSSLMLERLAKRMSLGLARTGSHAHHASGEIFLAFSTAGRVEHDLWWESEDWSTFFRAAVEATEEAVYSALVNSHTVENRRGRVESLDWEELLRVLAGS